MNELNLSDRREVLWDEFLMDTCSGVYVRMHRPEYRGSVFCADAPWEGNTTGYFHLLNEAVGARLYYRGCQLDVSDTLQTVSHTPTFCLSFSRDGKHFDRVPVNEHRFGACTQNNIVFDRTDDNFTVFRDENPDCPADERYKALSGTADRKLMYYRSADGVSFEFVRVLDDDGMYDTMNVAFWDAQSNEYRLYYRGMHDEQGRDFRWGRGQKGTPIRDIRLKTSSDFLTWSEAKRLDYGPQAPDIHMYTNQIRPYYRAPHVYLGIPTRYTDRVNDKFSLSALPDFEHRARVTQKWDRSGTAMTDCCLMTSRDGVHFRRTETAFLTPGPEREHNWYYGDCYTALGMLETKADRKGAPNEISIYMGENYRADNVELARYALRLDGFFSWRGDVPAACVITKPFVFDGNRLKLNFSTSALGHVHISMLDAEGHALEGYTTEKMFGDSTERAVCFEKPVADLKQKTVRMRMELNDADVYSFKFAKEFI